MPDHNELPEHLARLKNIERDVRDLRIAVLGNGSDGNALMSRMARVEEASKATWKIITVVVAAAAIVVAVFR